MSTRLKIAQDSIDAFNARDWDRMASSRAPNCLYDEVSTGRRQRGHAEIRKGMEAWTRAFPDLKGKVTNTLEHGDTVVMEISWEGTQEGPLDGPLGTVPPSGKSVANRAVQVLRFDHDQVTEIRHYFDLFNMLRQVGAIPTEKARKAGA